MTGYVLDHLNNNNNGYTTSPNLTIYNKMLFGYVNTFLDIKNTGHLSKICTINIQHDYDFKIER